ncbi:hypothetical protein PSAB6_100247 [Paraburkholderia sabiae]|nr:hypothetical protein PSAB6_100247 [Paraburkholderia sabiae]
MRVGHGTRLRVVDSRDSLRTKRVAALRTIAACSRSRRCRHSRNCASRKLSESFFGTVSVPSVIRSSINSRHVLSSRSRDAISVSRLRCCEIRSSSSGMQPQDISSSKGAFGKPTSGLDFRPDNESTKGLREDVSNPRGKYRLQRAVTGYVRSRA